MELIKGYEALQNSDNIIWLKSIHQKSEECCHNGEKNLGIITLAI
jgi:hypothetical protein